MPIAMFIVLIIGVVMWTCSSSIIVRYYAFQFLFVGIASCLAFVFIMYLEFSHHY